MTESMLFLVQGLFFENAGKPPAGLATLFRERSAAVAEYGESLGVQSYEPIDGGNRAIANRLLRMARGTAPAVDAVEIFEVDERTLRQSLTRRPGQEAWKIMAGCAAVGFDVGHSFILIGRLRLLIDGPAAGQRVLWFGHGLRQLSEDEFIAHYTGHHGPLVAGHASVLGICRYRQVANDEDDLCNSLRELGLGRAPPPPVFAELAMTAPPMSLQSFRARRTATRAIKADEKRHIDFSRSMLLLV